ncbi:MAG: iron chelate uptake ABC transporter family permease subunit [Dehalococcoidia bacterium]|nr:iron chelate uptake ABC transporter family permease subunit [Dehalococcoidia bacterium]
MPQDILEPSQPEMMPPPPAIGWRSRLYSIGGLMILLALVIIFAASLGSADIPFSTTWHILLFHFPEFLVSKLPFLNIHYTFTDNTEIIIMDTRLPRIILAGLVGASLSIAGTTYQGIFRNPLADPYLIGVSQGALMGAAIAMLLPLGWSGMGDFGVVPPLAFAGAMVSVSVVYAVARTGRSLPVTTLILAGVAVGAFMASVTSYLMTTNEELHGIVSWILGRFSLSNWDQVLVVLPFVVIGSLIIWLYSRPLNIMQLDEDQAQQLGIDVERVKLTLLICATLITAAAVSFCGTIGFVGIIVPHAARLVWGPDHRSLLPLAALSGAIFLILADTLARTVTDPSEIPVGVITAFIGAPFFLYLLRKKKRGTFF